MAIPYKLSNVVRTFDPLRYVNDGKCHNAQPGTYGHECGKPATWVGSIKPGGFQSGFCNRCKIGGYEAREYTVWEPHPNLANVER